MKRLDYIVFFLVVGYLLSGTGALALETTLEVAAGYDDNPAEITQGEGSGVSRYFVQLAQPVLDAPSGARVELIFNGLYSQYFSTEDNYLLLAVVDSSLPLGDRFRVGGFIEGSAYRDKLMAEDEYNQLLVGGQLQWLVDARLTLSLLPTFSTVDYRNPVSLPGERTSASAGKGRGHGAGGSDTGSGGTQGIRYDRDDTVRAAEMTATYLVSPDIQVDLSAVYRDLEATDDVDSYRETGGSGRVSWYYSDAGELYLSGYASRLDFDAAPDGGSRRDEAYGIGLGVSRWFGAVKLSATFDRTENDSPIAGENYEKSVVLCGVSYTF